MQAPFNDNLKEIANSMGIALYQRFTLNEASLFLRCPESDIRQLLRQNKIDHINVTNSQTEFFGYQLLQYLLSTVSGDILQVPHETSSSERILRSKEVQEMTGLSRTTIWRMERKGQFPVRVSLGVNSVGWLFSQIDSWIKSR